MEAGMFAINMSDFYVKDIIDEVYDMYEQQLLRKNIELRVDFDERLNTYMIRSDRSRLKQVLMNLLTNSCKFTFQGSITVSINVFSNDDNDFVKFCVSDTGIGIKKEDQSKLFRLFGMIELQIDEIIITYLHRGNNRIDAYHQHHMCPRVPQCMLVQIW